MTAVLLVLGSHMTPAMLAWGGDVTALWQRAGWIGVDLFFVLSGFLVGGLLMAEVRRSGSFDYKRFLVRRGFKIYPAFYFMLAVTLVVWWRWGAESGLRIKASNVVAEALFVQNYKGPIWQQDWSLAVEEHFYLLLPFVQWDLLRRSGRTGARSDPFSSLPMIVLVLCVALLVLRIVRAYLHLQTGRPFEFAPLMYRTHVRIDSLAFGVLLAYWQHFHRSKVAEFLRRWRWGMLALGCVLAAPAAFWPCSHPFMHSAGFTCLYLAFGSLLIVLVNCEQPVNPKWVVRGVTFVAANSYSVYLWHMAWLLWGVPLVVRWTGMTSPGEQLVLYAAGAVAFGVALGRLVEWPMLAVRDRWFPSRTAT